MRVHLGDLEDEVVVIGSLLDHGDVVGALGRQVSLAPTFSIMVPPVP